MTLDDKYTYPGSGGVLVNRLGIQDAARLDQALNDYASAGWAILRTQPVPEPPGFEYLRTIHREMFSPLLEWAGELRTGDAQATGVGIAYARPVYIAESLRTLFDRLEGENFLAGLDASTFADRLADRWGELSAIHPFRDGNTRSQSAYVSAIAQRAGHAIDWTLVDVPTLRTLRLAAIVGQHEPLAAYLRDRLLPAMGERGAASSLGLDPASRDAARLAGLDTPNPPRTSSGSDVFGSIAYRPDGHLGRGPGLGR